MNFDIETVSVLINLVTALAAVAGVIAAVKLGRRAVTIARETVGRASLDYAAGRADLITQARVDIVERMAEVEASLHVYWKEDPSKLLAEDPHSARAKELIVQRNAAEIEAHRAMYRLQGAAIRLKEVLPSAQILETRRGRARKITSVKAPVNVDMPRVLGLVDLYARSAWPMYFSLVSSARYVDPAVAPEPFKKQFLDDLRIEDSEESQFLWRDQVRKWLDQEMAVVSDQTTPAIITINFVERFLDDELADRVHEVTNAVHAESRAAIAVMH